MVTEFLVVDLRSSAYHKSMSAENQDVPYRNSSDTAPATEARDRSAAIGCREPGDPVRGARGARGARVHDASASSTSRPARAWASRRSTAAGPSKEALAQELLAELAAPAHRRSTTSATRATELWPLRRPTRCTRSATRRSAQVIRTLLSQIADQPRDRRPVPGHGRPGPARARSPRVIARGIERGDLRPGRRRARSRPSCWSGPVYFRLMFGGDLSDAFADRVADTVYEAYAVQRG